MQYPNNIFGCATMGYDFKDAILIQQVLIKRHTTLVVQRYWCVQEAVDNDSGSGDLSKLVLNVPPGEGLYVILEGWGPSECGVVNLVVTAEPPPSPPPPSLPVRCVVLCLKIIFYTLSNTALYRLALCTYFTRDQTLLSRGLLSVHILHVIKHCSLEACSLYIFYTWSNTAL